MTSLEEKTSDWLERLLLEVRIIVLALNIGEYDKLFDRLAVLFDEQVEITEDTWEIKNLLASLVVTDPNVYRGRTHLVNATTERLMMIRSRIKKALDHE